MLPNNFIWITLFFNFYKLVTGKLSWDLKLNEKEQLLEKFLKDAESHLMRNCPSRHTTIIAQKNNLLRTAKSIFKSRPYFVGTNSKVFVQSREYADNCVFVLVDAIDYDYLSTIFSHLPRSYNTKLAIVTTNNLLKHEAKNVLDLAYNKSIENVTITFLENNAFKAFQVYLYTRSCKRKVRLSYVWVPNKGLKQYYYDDNSPRNLNKCPVPISTLPLEESIIIRENTDGTLDILGGAEGNLILTIARKLNFTAAIKYPEIRDWEDVVNNTVVGLVGDIAYGKSVIAIGQLIPALRRYKYSDFTTSYDHTCIVWTVSAIVASVEDVLYSEFSTYLWLAVLLSIIFSCVFIYVVSRIKSRKRERQSYICVILDVIYATLGFPVHRLPTNRPGKIYFLSYIFYAIVAITAYQTYLASILTVRKDAQLIKTEADIARSKLISGGAKNMLSVLKSQQEGSPYIPYLINNFEIFVNTVIALDRIKNKKDFAFAIDLSTMQYYQRNLILAGKEVYFYTFNECIISYHRIILVHKGSALTTELNNIIEKLRESGIINLWNNEKSNVDLRDIGGSHEKLQQLNPKLLQSVFILYLSGIILSTIIMILEIIFHSLSKRSN